MAKKAETLLVNRIRKALDERYGEDGKWIKLHGSAMQERGLPDLLGALSGRAVAMEVKVPGETPTPLQVFRLKQFARAGAITGAVESVEQALELAASVLRPNAQSSGAADLVRDASRSEDSLVDAQSGGSTGQPSEETDERFSERPRARIEEDEYVQDE